MLLLASHRRVPVHQAPLTAIEQVENLAPSDAILASLGRQEARMLLPGLRAFLAVAQAGSMREAAARLRLAQSAVSRRIHMMEEELGVALLERGARGVALTPAGDILLHHAREASQQAERLLADLDALRGVRRGHVVVRTVESFAASTLPHVLGSFRSAYPAVTLDVTVAGSDAILAAVRDRLCHFGIAFNPPADPEVEVLGSVAEPLAVAVGPGHSLARAKRVSLAQVAELPLVAPARLGGSRLLFDAACRAANVAIRPALETNSAHVVAAFLADDQSVAILSPGILSAQVASGRVTILELAEPLLAGGRISLLTRPGRRLPPAAEALGILLARGLCHANRWRPGGGVDSLSGCRPSPTPVISSRRRSSSTPSGCTPAAR